MKSSNLFVDRISPKYVRILLAVSAVTMFALSAGAPGIFGP